MTGKICQKNKASYPTFWSLPCRLKEKQCIPEKIFPAVYYISDGCRKSVLVALGETVLVDL